MKARLEDSDLPKARQLLGLSDLAGSAITLMRTYLIIVSSTGQVCPDMMGMVVSWRSQARVW